MLEGLQAWPGEASWARPLQVVVGAEAAEPPGLMAPSGSEACNLLHRHPGMAFTGPQHGYGRSAPSLHKTDNAYKVT